MTQKHTHKGHIPAICLFPATRNKNTGLNHPGKNPVQVSYSGRRLSNKHGLLLNHTEQRGAPIHPRPFQSLLEKEAVFKRNLLKLEFC